MDGSGLAPRGSFFAVWKWPRCVLSALLIPLTVTAYLLSEAPVMRFHQERVRTGRVAASPMYARLGMRIYDPNFVVYRPAHWVYDNTPLQSVLLTWAKLWGVESEVIIIHVMRASGPTTTNGEIATIDER